MTNILYETRYTLTKPFGGRPAGTRVRLRTYHDYEDALNLAVRCARRPYVKDVAIVELECRDIGYIEVEVDGRGELVARPNPGEMSASRFD
jgi:hypothetical protein